MSKILWYTHINRGIIDSNRKHNSNNPPISIRKGKTGKAKYAHKVKLPEGELVYSAHKPILSCGARLVFISKKEPEIVE